MNRIRWVLLMTLGLALGLAGGSGCGRKSARDYSATEYISVDLRDKNREYGLRHLEARSAGGTVAASIGGSPCRSLKLGGQTEGYLYFALHPTFKTNAANVTVDVEYYDATQGSFDLQYDGPEGAHTRCQGVVVQRRTLKWETARFVLRDARFQNAQTNGADFRLRIRTPECFVRHVGVLRGTADGLELNSAPVAVSLELGEPLKETGLQLIRESDGRATPARVNDQPCHRFATNDGAYMYFAITPAFKWDRRMNVKVEVEYFDASPGTLELQYDSWNLKAGKEDAYAKCPYRVPLNRSRTWKKALFLLPDARFENRQNGDADFRLHVSRPELFIRRVAVQRRDRPAHPESTPETVSLTFGKPDLAQGLEQSFDPDSLTAPANIAGRDCLAVNLYKNKYGCVYFVVDDAFKFSGATNYIVDMEYYSAVPAVFRIQYDGYQPGSPAGDPYTSTPRVNRPAGRWQTERFSLSNARFQNSQNGNADFRLNVYTPEFFVHQVTLRRQPDAR